jgi:hypothetical protein
MNKTLLLSFLAAWLALAGSPAHAQGSAAGDNTGTLQGRVLNERTAQYLEGARVSIEGTGLVTLTDA